jgi:hypothetical protein
MVLIKLASKLQFLIFFKFVCSASNKCVPPLTRRRAGQLGWMGVVVCPAGPTYRGGERGGRLFTEEEDATYSCSWNLLCSCFIGGQGK